MTEWLWEALRGQVADSRTGFWVAWGYMGARGPTPKRSDQRRNRRKVDVDKSTEATEDVEQPEADPNWHPVARQWYDSLAESAQSIFYEPSDWATAYFLAEAISRELEPQALVFKGMVMPETIRKTISGGTLGSILKGMTSLLVTESDRRRMQIELQRAREEGASADGTSNVTDIDEYLQSLESS